MSPPPVAKATSDKVSSLLNGRSQTESSSSSNGGGVNLLPQPPPLDFPYHSKPVENGVTAQIPKQPPETPTSPNGTPVGLAYIHSGEKPPTSADDLDFDKPPVPLKNGLRRVETDRPPLIPRGSNLATLSRAQTQRANEFNTLAWDSDSDDLSSSDDEKHNGRAKSIWSARSHKSEKSAKPDLQSQKSDGSVKRAQEPDHDHGAEDPFRKFSLGNHHFKTRGKVSKRDGRLKISIHDTSNKGYLAHTLSASMNKRQMKGKTDDTSSSGASTERKKSRPSLQSVDTASTIDIPTIQDTRPRPRLNIVIMIIGSRGDIQPFMRVGKILKEQHGHRVRIATHPTFREFVEDDCGLEFFSIGGDPAELMAFMVKNPGLIPKANTFRSGEIPRRRESMYQMFQGFWRACINSSDDEHDQSNLKTMSSKAPFVADAIIANPVSFAHIHCAERLGIPLHLMFTFPNSPTQQFPHPLTNIKQSNVDANYTNFMSYPLVEMMHWQGLGDLINDFRTKILGLEPMSTLWAPGQIFRMQVPYSYMWSPALIPKPPDWGPEIDITGFVFLDLAGSFKPPKELVEFLDKGEPPIYIGFGSIVVDDPEHFTKLIFDAVKKAGVRALVSKGWGKLGDESNTPDHIYMLENTPHDWLFPRVKAVIHHGGAGTTAIGMKCGKPTMVVPFFGDQPFWGAMVWKAGAGAEPVPYKSLDSDKLAEGIKVLLKPETLEGAKKLAKKIEAEGDGAENAVRSFHRSLPLKGTNSIRCPVLENRVAVWTFKNLHFNLSALAAEILVANRRISWSQLRLIRHCEWNDFEGPGEPLSGTGGALAASMFAFFSGIGLMPVHWAKQIKNKADRDKRHREKKAKKLAHENAKDERLNRAKNTGADLDTERSRRMDKPEGDEHDDTMVESDEENDDLARQMALEAGRGAAKSGGALAKLPMDLSLAIARGFHNAPRLYGDNTVRTARHITGIKSGMKAAGSEFVLGVYDGFSGVVTQPYRGAKDDGVAGFTKGVGKGSVGFLLKNLAAIFGVPAYAMKGIHREMTKPLQPTNKIRRGRIIEGVLEFQALNDAERKAVTAQVREGWQVINDVQKAIRHRKKQGIKGQVHIMKRGRDIETFGVLENLDQARRALKAMREGRDLKEEFATEIAARDAEREHKRREHGRFEKRKRLAFATSKKDKISAMKSMGVSEDQAKVFMNDPAMTQGSWVDEPNHLKEPSKDREDKNVAGEDSGVEGADHAEESDRLDTVPEGDEAEAPKPHVKTASNDLDMVATRDRKPATGPQNAAGSSTKDVPNWDKLEDARPYGETVGPDGRQVFEGGKHHGGIDGGPVKGFGPEELPLAAGMAKLVK